MKKLRLILLTSFMIIFTGCASYTTPGGSVQLSSLSDSSINELMSKKPAASFPANISIVRVQASGYQSHKISSFGYGRYSVVTSRDVESKEDFQKLASLPEVRSFAPINKMLLPTKLDKIKVLREASARLKADILLMYTFDTSFHIGEQKLAPLNVLSLGFLRNKEVSVSTTVSAAFFDVRNEYLYGLTETTISDSKNASVWSTSDVVDDLRFKTEKKAFKELIPQIEKTWTNIVAEYKK